MRILVLFLSAIPVSFASVSGGSRCVVESFTDTAVICKATGPGKKMTFKRSEVKERQLSYGQVVFVPVQKVTKRGRSP